MRADRRLDAILVRWLDRIAEFVILSWHSE